MQKPRKKKRNRSVIEEAAVCTSLIKVEAEKLFLQGVQLDEANQLEAALRSLQQAVTLSQKIGYRLGEGACSYNIGIILNSLRQYQAAINNFKKSLAIARKLGDRIQEAKSLNQLGCVYFSQREYELATKSYQQSLTIEREIGDCLEEANLLGKLGCIFYFQGHYNQAIEYHNQQLTTAQEIENYQAEGTALNNLGNVYQALGEYTLAIKYYRQSLKVKQEIIQGNRQEEAQSLSNLGAVFHCLGQDEIAIEHYHQSLAIVREIGDIAQEARVIGNLGITYESLGQYQLAIEHYEQDLAIIRKIRAPQEEAQCLGNIGNVYKSLGQYDLAIKLHQQSLKIQQAIGNQLGEARSLANLGVAYRSKEQYNLAIENQQQSLELSRKIRNCQGEASSLFNLGNTYCSVEKYELATQFYQQSLAIMQEISDRRGEAYVLGGLGNFYHSLSKYEQAIDYYQQQLVIAQEIDERQLEGMALNNIGGILFQFGKLAEAESILREGIQLWESLRTGLRNDADKISMFDTQTDAYCLLQKVLVTQNKTNDALEIAERGRARAFVELLARRLSTEPVVSMNKFRLQATLEEPPTINKIKQIAADQNSTIVEYSIIYSDSLYIWVIKPIGETIFCQVDIKPLLEDDTSLEEMAMEARRRIDESSWPDDAQYFAQKLYQYLIRPIACLLPTDSNATIIFIPQRELFLIPFAVLQDQKGKFLIEQHTVLIAPSIKVLELLRQQKERLRSKEWGTRGNYLDALVVGNPTMPIQPSSKPPQQLKPLPYAQEEAKEIASLLKTEALIGEKATKVDIVQQMARARIIHLATHGILNDIYEFGIPGAIALAPSGTDNGFLTSSEILDMELNAELVVLSACDTGRGRITADGVIGLSRCLFLAGVPSVIVSLWEVPDNSTKLLMTKFYQNLQQGMNKVQSLCQAMRATMEQYRYCPKMWAAFNLIGEAE